MNKDLELAEAIGSFREILGDIAENGPARVDVSTYRGLRHGLLDDDRAAALPDFVVECRSPRDFWDYIRRAFRSYSERSQYIEAQLLPVERQFRPKRDKVPGTRPPEVRIEYSPVRPASPSGLPFVADDRLAELRTAKSDQFDLQKVVRICEELNVTYSEGCYLSTVALVRSLLDHVPPVFGKRTFTEVANNHCGRSLKESMQRLETSARKIADSHLHGQIRQRETLPVAQQVNFAAEVDVLLAEIIRIVA